MRFTRSAHVPEHSPLEHLVAQVIAAISAPPDPNAPPPAEVSMRERFMELLVLSLASLYGKTPVPASPFDRNMMKLITDGLDDNEAGRFTTAPTTGSGSKAWCACRKARRITP